MKRRDLTAGIAALLALAGCGVSWSVGYDAPIDPRVSRTWHLHRLDVVVPENLTVSNENSFAPNADIVWHGEPFGDRREQVAAILREGVARGASGLSGPNGVRMVVTLRQFHAVTPAAVSNAPSAVHNISYTIQVFDDGTASALTEPQIISADLEALVGSAAVTAAIQGQTQRVRIVDHLERVTRGWLGVGPDPRRRFGGFGR